MVVARDDEGMYVWVYCDGIVLLSAFKGVRSVREGKGGPFPRSRIECILASTTTRRKC
jgi:hypothetical protein